MNDPARVCSDPSLNISRLNQQFTSGPSLPSPASEGTVLSIMCSIGYRWTTGNDIRNINRLQNGFWQFESPCEGSFLQI